MLRYLEGSIDARSFQVIVLHYGLHGEESMEYREIERFLNLPISSARKLARDALERIQLEPGFEPLYRVYTGGDIGERIKELRSRLEEIHRSEIFREERNLCMELEKLLGITYKE